jgi:hypothetical protein
LVGVVLDAAGGGGSFGGLDFDGMLFKKLKSVKYIQLTRGYYHG